MTELVSMLINDEFPIILPKERADLPLWQIEGGWERERLRAMHQHIGRGDVVYYVGAEQGDLPALCQMWGARMYLFEPAQKTWPCIKAVWEANGLEDPISFVGFASNETTPGAHLVSGFPECADGELLINPGFAELRDVKAQAQIRLDDVAAQWEPPTVISFDVEGSEFQVMRGAEQILLEHRPTVFASIHPEFMFDHFREYSRNLRDWIMDRGYREEYLQYEHELHTVYYPK